MLDFNISFSNKFNYKEWAIVINCGEKIKLPDGTILDNFESGLFHDIKFSGDKLLIFKIGENFEVSDKIADFCRKNWAQVYEIFPFEIFKNTDFYRSPKMKLRDYEFNFWYCGENFPCGIHKEHKFFEVHTQILGFGEMQKFRENDPKTLFFREILSPGQIHKPFFDKNQNYPWHQYHSKSKCIWLVIESPFPIPKK